MSNYRELSNLIHAKSKGLLKDTALFVFTDNFVAKSTFHKGTELMLTLCKLQMHQGLSLHTIHVSGKQRIAKGTDGLSRGLMTMGVMTGFNMLNYVQLHLDALERQGPTLKDWILNWFWIKLKFLEPRGWLCEDNTYSTYIWSPPPAAAEVVGAVGIQHS
jgi:hypothetical protein